jgi:molybdopterin-guanine dinucleotide biosynthesis protein A
MNRSLGGTQSRFGYLGEKSLVPVETARNVQHVASYYTERAKMAFEY